MRTTDKFTQAYIACALWSSNDETTASGGEPFDRNYSPADLADETFDRMCADCAKFQTENADYLHDYPTKNAGHDFWLTRNGHGAGFWENDFGTEEDCTKLTQASKAFNTFNLYLGDDGKIYGS